MINIDPVTGNCSGVALKVLAGYRRQRANILFGQFLARESSVLPQGDHRGDGVGARGEGGSDRDGGPEGCDGWEDWVCEGMKIRAEA